MRAVASLLAVLFLAVQPAQARPSSMPVPRPAPAWEVSEWINSKGAKLADLKGKVVVIEFFQLWCPGCNQFSIPLIKKWHKEFARPIRDGRMHIVSIHTVFEGFGYQTPERLRRFVKRKEIRHPVGIDRHVAGQHVPATMRRYGTSGTPEMAIVDKNGMIRFQHFGGFHVPAAERLIRRLLAE